MTTNNSVNVGLAGSTGTGTFVGATSPALVLPTSNNFIEGYSTTATAAGTTVLTSSSNYQQFFTGSTTQTVTLPVTSTMVLGQGFWIVNGSSGIVTVQSSGSNTVAIIPADGNCLITCILTSGTGASSWNAEINSGSSGVTSITGTANQIIASAATGAVTLSAPQDIATSSSPTFVNMTLTGATIYYTGNISMLGLLNTASAVNYVTIGNNITGSKPSISSTGSDTDVGLTIACKGAGTFLFNSAATTNQWSIVTGTGLVHTSIMNFPGTSASRTYTWPDAAGTMLITGTAINSVPSITFSSTSGVIGTTTNDNAATGSVGEYISSNVVQGSPVSIGSTGATINVTSISLTAGDWDVFGNVIFITSIGAQRCIAWISTTSATIVDGSLYASTGTVTSVQNPSLSVPLYRVSVSSTTTVYLSAYADFASGTVGGAGSIYARRVR